MQSSQANSHNLPYLSGRLNALFLFQRFICLYELLYSVIEMDKRSFQNFIAYVRLSEI